MQQKYFGMIMLMLAGLMVVPMAQAQKYDITPVNLDSIWNRVIWFQDDDPNISSGGPGIKVSTLPPDVIPGQVNVSEDGMVSFLLPDMTIGNPNAYYGVTGDTVSVPEGKYQYVFMASTADDGPWPGGVSGWGADVDPDTGEVYDPRSERNSFKPIYDDGEGDWIPMGVVPDWFWKPPEWVAPADGDASEIVNDYMCYQGDPNGPIYFWYGEGNMDHNLGQFTYCNGEGAYFIYLMDIPAGLKSATLWTEMWGNVKMSISTDDQTYTEVYNSATEDKVYTAPPGNPDGIQTNRELRDFDLTPFLSSGTVRTIYFKFEDAAPLNAIGQPNNPWGPRVHRLGIFTGPVVKASSGIRIWPGMETISWGMPEGGIYMIWQLYRIDPTRTLKAILLPNDVPQHAPTLILFAISLGNDRATGVKNYMLY